MSECDQCQEVVALYNGGQFLSLEETPWACVCPVCGTALGLRAPEPPRFTLIRRETPSEVVDIQGDNVA